MKVIHVITPDPVDIDVKEDDIFYLDDLGNYYPSKFGFDENGEQYVFLTNADQRDRHAVYEEAVRTWDGPEEFGIADYATGRHGQELRGHFAFYTRPIDWEFGLSAFWAHFRAIQFDQHGKASARY
jgi:hypothetical protein